MHRWAWIACSWLTALAPAAAQPEPLPLELEWTAPAGCPSAAEVRSELERIARVRPGYTLRPLAAEAQVVRKPAGFRVSLRTMHEGRRGERSFEAADCPTLVRSVTLILALAFGPALEVATDAPPSGPPPAAAAVPADGATVSEPDPEPEPAPDRPIPISLAVLVTGTGALNLFPSPAAAVAVGLQLRLGAYALEVRSSLFPRSSSDLTPAIRTHLRALGGSLAACRLDALSAGLELTTCAGARLASLSARTSGALERSSATAPWTALAAGAAVSWPSGSWLQLRLELAVALSLTQPRFVVESFGDAHRVPLFVPELGLGVLVHF